MRTARGKKASGTVILRAFHQAGKVNIAITDDGAGIDAEKLKAKAIEKGLITTSAAREMTERGRDPTHLPPRILHGREGHGPSAGAA